MRSFFIILFSFFLCYPLFSQDCPEGALQGVNGSKDCLQLSWTSPPVPLPSEMTSGGLTYVYDSGSGTTGDPAYYKASGANCNFTLNPFTGDVIVDGITCTYVAGTLPVEFGEINIHNSGKGVIITWTTISEVNNDIFILERSLDGNKFSEIGQVNGNGTKSSPTTYKYHDNNLQKGLVYYRITQVDFDGNSSSSPIVSTVIHPDESSLISYDNRSIYISHPGSYSYLLIRSDGQIISQEKNINNSQVDLAEFPTGIYVVEIITDNGIRQSKKIMIRR